MRALLTAVMMLALLAGAAGQTAAPPAIVVTDENGVAVSGARVFLRVQQTGTTAQSPALRCETDFNGHCSFPGLAEGAYQLRIEKEGFYELLQSSVQIAPGSTVEAVISRQQEVREVVDVRESPPAIDPAQVAAQETISGMEVIDIPYATTED